MIPSIVLIVGSLIPGAIALYVLLSGMLFMETGGSAVSEGFGIMMRIIAWVVFITTFLLCVTLNVIAYLTWS